MILAFDTAGPWCAAALWRDAPVSDRLEPMARGQAERLMPMLEEVLAEAGLNWGDLTAIGVGTGPGNFTGIRIGVAAARGLAMALGVPSVGVTATDALLARAPAGAWAAIPAPRGQVYAARAGKAPVLRPEGEAPAGAVRPAPGANPAPAIARIIASRLGTPQPRPAPTYARPPDAAPARPAPPTIPPTIPPTAPPAAA